MKTMVLHQIINLKENQAPLAPQELPRPAPGPDEILIRVSVCGVCHTELDEIEGRLPPTLLPVVPGHQVVGEVVKTGQSARRFRQGDRVGVGWIYSACGTCEYCRAGNENLCPDFKATGRDVDGGYAEFMCVSEAFAHPIPDVYSDAEAAPLLCAGAIGYRSLRLTRLQNGQRLGLTGFGASAHLVLQLVRHHFPDSEIYVFARNSEERAFARDLGAKWAGDTGEKAPRLLHSIIDTTPAWRPVVEALKNLVPGGRLVINAIRKEAGDKDYLQNLHYPTHLWHEKEIKSVANVSRKDIAEFLQMAAAIPLRPTVEEFRLKQANEALVALKEKQVRGAKVLRI